MGLMSIVHHLEVKPTDDEFESIKTTRWGNKDVYPIPHDKRTYGVLAFFAYWGTCGISISSWTIGSSLIGIGLTAGQACGVVVNIYLVLSREFHVFHISLLLFFSPSPSQKYKAYQEILTE